MVSDSATGHTFGYAYQQAGITYSYTPELRGESFNPDRGQIEPSWTEFWAGSVAMIEAIKQELSLARASTTHYTTEQAQTTTELTQETSLGILSCRAGVEYYVMTSLLLLCSHVS